MDERKLAELLQDAVADVPPPTFDQGDVARASDRLRVRRNGILKGSAFGVAILAGATALSVALWTGGNSAEQTSAVDSSGGSGNGTAGPYELPMEGDAGTAETQRDGDQNSSPESRKQGRSSEEDAGPIGPGSTPSGCEQADRELAAALAGELPAAAQIQAEDAMCGQGVTGATFRLDDGSTISAMLFEPGTLAGFGEQPGWEYEQAQATTADDRTVVIISAAPDAPPYADRLDEWAAAVALRY